MPYFIAAFGTSQATNYQTHENPRVAVKCLADACTNITMFVIKWAGTLMAQ
jgi:hypothetical protein